MIKAEDYPHHVELLGSEEEFYLYIKRWYECMPDYPEERMKEILDGEEIAKASVSFWCAPWM